MSARTLTQLAVVVLAVLAAVLGVVLFAQGGGGATGTGADAGSCDLITMPTALSPRTEDAVLLLWAEKGVKATLDGKAVVSLPEDPQSFPIGEHLVHAECAGGAADLRVELEAFTPAAVWVGCAGPPTFQGFGARCASCLPIAEARKLAAKAGKDSGLFASATAQEKLMLLERTRARSVLTGRWNSLTERYSRVLQVVGREAPGAVASANSRFEELSRGFKQATQTNDPVGQDQSIRTAEETLRVFVRAARLARPTDCDFQKRLTDSF